MYTKNVFELLTVFIIYSLTIFGLAEIIARPFTRNKRLPIRYFIDLIVGHFYIINMMFLLAYMKLIYRPIVLFVMIFVAIIFRYLIEPKRINAYFQKKISLFTQLFAGEYGFRLAFMNVLDILSLNIRTIYKRISCENLIEFFFIVGVLGIHLYYASYQTLNFISYGAPDVEVHLYWIQSLVGGELFPVGVYPFGMHCIGAALSTLYDIPAVVIARMLGVVASTYIMLNCYLFIREICKLKYVAALAMIAYLLCNYGASSTYSRYAFMITQEYAMLFLYPMAIFLYRYLRQKKKEDLIFFGISFSLTLAVHFYVTVVALIFCLAVGIAFLVYMWKNKVLVPILVTGLISTAVAIFPLAVGLATGYELEQSFKYGASVISNDAGLYGGEEGRKSELTLDKPYTMAGIEEKVQKILQAYVVKKLVYVLFYLIPMAIIFVICLFKLCVSVYKRQRDFNSLWSISMIVYGVLLFAQEFAIIFDLPVILDAQRNAIFLAYYSPVLIALALNCLYQLFSENEVFYRVASKIMVGAIFCFVFFIVQFGFVKDHGYVYYFQTKGAMVVMEDIIENYDKYSWTVVSPVNETSIVYNTGYHYELVEFLFEQEEFDERTEIFIPTPYVFFIAEKLPINRYGYPFTIEEVNSHNRESISYEYMMEEITTENRQDKYYHDQRSKLMSRIFYWAQAYMQLFPDEMTVYYEDEEVVVYRLKQNAYALNNLAIDYKSLTREDNLNE